ncbi:YcxB family protein [Flavobacterium chungangensis]|uniref:YcxB family protein n=1 Tax=Flavobacterium chungangensis TaxID=2708132 RepID=A0ABV8Z7W9_9FLAO
MELNYSLTENDYLQQQLYIVSKNDFFKKERRNNNIAIIVLVTILALFSFLITKDVFFIYAFLLLLLIYCCVSSRYLKWASRIRLKKYVDSVYLKKCGIITNVKFEENHILTSASIIETKLKFIGFQNISEIEDYFFITFITDENFIIPKKHIEDVSALRNLLKEIAEKRSIDFISELDWKWK